MYSVFNRSLIAISVILVSSVSAQELLPVVGNGNMYRYMAPISQSSVDNMIAESGGLVDNRPEPVLGELLVLESSSFGGASDFSIRELFSDGDPNTSHSVFQSSTVDFRINEPATIMVSANRGGMSLSSTSGQEVRRSDGSLLLPAGGRQWAFYSNISGPSAWNYEYRDLPAGDYTLTLSSNDIIFYEITPRIPDHLNEPLTGLVLNSFTRGSSEGYGAAYFDGVIDNRQDTTRDSTIDVTLQQSGRISIGHDIWGGISGTNLGYGVSIAPIGDDLRSVDGVKLAQGGYPLYVGIGDTEVSEAVFPAGQYRISTINDTHPFSRFDASYTIKVAEIGLVPEPVEALDTGAMQITDWLLDGGNEGIGYLPAWFDGDTTSRLSSARFAVAGDYIDFTLTEPSYVGYYNVYNSNTSNERVLISQVGNTGIVDQADGTRYMNGDYLFEDNNGIGKYMSYIPFPAGDYRMYTPNLNYPVLSEIYTEPFTGFPALAANQVKVDLISTRTSPAYSTAGDAFGHIALVDGITTIDGGFDYVRGSINYPTVSFSISEPARIGAYAFDRVGTQETAFEVFPVGGTNVFDVDGNLVAKDGMIVIVDSDGYFGTGHILPAGDYEFRVPRGISSDNLYIPQISEIMAFTDKRDVTGTAQLGNVDVTILDYLVGGNLQTTSPRYGDMRYWVNGEILNDSKQLVGEMVNNGNFIEFEIQEAATVSFYVIDKTQNSEPLRVWLRSDNGSIFTEFAGNGNGWRTTAAPVPAGIYRVGKYNGRSWNDYSVTEIRAVR